MGLYRDRVLPHLIHFAMRNRVLAEYRARLLSRAKGRVLEIGIGSGLNLPFYTPAVDELLGLEPSARLADMARNAARSDLLVAILRGGAERIPLAGHIVDTVVTTWTLCSIQDVAQGLAEIRRVLKPGGALLFVEHGLAPEAHISKWQRRLTPLWTPVSGGCHLDRPIPRLIENAGFEIEALETGYMDGPKLATFLYEGIARPR
jgi:SAM-dependent methyltransferase